MIVLVNDTPVFYYSIGSSSLVKIWVEIAIFILV